MVDDEGGPAILVSSQHQVTKGSLLAGYLEFYFAKQRGGLDPLSLNDQEKGTPPLPPRDGLLGTMRQKAFNRNDLERDKKHSSSGYS